MKIKKISLILLLFFITKVLFGFEVTIGDFKYKINDGTAEISSCVKSKENYINIIIPSSITYGGSEYMVTSIGDYAFGSCSYLTSITIPNSITLIGDYAFLNCLSLTSITIPNSVTFIGERVFKGCSKLISVEWNAENYYGISSKESSFFYDIREQITSFVFGDSVVYIPYCLCYGMNKLTSIVIPNSVTIIGFEAFYNCSSLKSIEIPEQVSDIGYSAFDRCSSVSSVKWNAKSCSDFTQRNAPFYDIRNQITSFEFGDSVQHIPSNLCSGMKKLTSILIPNSVDSIETKAFSDCSSLPFISIPYKVKFIGKDVFAGCSKITSVRWNAESCPYSSNYMEEDPFHAIKGQITSFVFGDSVQHIPAYLCEDMTKLTSIVIPNSVISIGRNAFCCCDSVSSIVLGESISSIEHAAFAFDNVSFIKINTIKPPTLSSSSSLPYNSRDYYIYIPDNTLSAYRKDWDNVSSYGYYNYINNETVLSINLQVPGTLSDCILDAEKRIFNIVKFDVTGLLNEEDFTCIKQDMTSLVEVDMSGVVNEKGVDFCNKKRLKKIILPKNLTEIKDSAFYYCGELNSIKIPSTLTRIGVDVFYYCVELSSLELPSSISEIGNNAFEGCISLTSIKCLGFTPPNADELGLNTSNCTLWVPKESFKDYGKHTYWGKFLNIKTLEDGYKKVNIISINDSLGVVNSINGYYNANDLVNIIAIPKEGCHFVKWSDGNTENSRTIVVTEDVALTAEFAINKYEVNVIVDGNGTVTGSGTYDYGTEVIIEAVANEGYHFVQWSDGNTENPRTIVVTEDVELQAEFEEDVKTFVDNVDESSVMIYVQYGVIYVEGADSDCHVFDAAGRLIYTGRDAQLSLPRGVYVVNVGGEVQKVVI